MSSQKDEQYVRHHHHHKQDGWQKTSITKVALNKEFHWPIIKKLSNFINFGYSSSVFITSFFHFISLMNCWWYYNGNRLEIRKKVFVSVQDLMQSFLGMGPLYFNSENNLLLRNSCGVFHTFIQVIKLLYSSLSLGVIFVFGILFWWADLKMELQWLLELMFFTGWCSSPDRILNVDLQRMKDWTSQFSYPA